MKINKSNLHVKEKGTLESVRSREIVKEIINFGVNDFQIKKIIKFLSLELENRVLMVEISKIIDENLKNEKQNKCKIET